MTYFLILASPNKTVTNIKNSSTTLTSTVMPMLSCHLQDFVDGAAVKMLATSIEHLKVVDNTFHLQYSSPTSIYPK